MIANLELEVFKNGMMSFSANTYDVYLTTPPTPPVVILPALALIIRGPCH